LAAELDSPTVNSEHILLGIMLSNSTAALMLKNLGVTFEGVSQLFHEVESKRSVFIDG